MHINKKKGAGWLVRVALLSALAIVLQIAENMIAVPYPVPGGKLGISNIVLLVALDGFGFTAAAAVILVKTLAAGLLHSGIMSCIYSLTASFASLLAMVGTRALLKDQVSLIGISVIGAFFFNVTQVCVAALVLGGTAVFAYLPFLIVVSAAAGCVTGLVGELAAKRLAPFFRGGIGG